jgi:hypothetical protein
MDTSQPGEATTGRQHAAAVIERVFRGVQPGIRCRLWDGSEHDVGRPDGAFTLVIRDRDTFRKAFGRAHTGALAQAFVDNRIDIEGDLFAAMRFANGLEDVKLTMRDKIGLLLHLRRI